MNDMALSLQPKLLSDLVSGLGVYSQDASVRRLCDDTRRLRQGDTFLCLPRVPNRKAMIAKAVRKGAESVVVVGKPEEDMGVPCACLPDMQAAGAMLRRWFETEQSRVPCIGITGTDGKTSTAWMLREVLALHLGSAWSCGTLGWVRANDDMQDLGNTTPSLMVLHRIYALAQRQGIGALVLEVSSHGIEQERIAGLSFAAAVWTTMGQDHLEDHGGLDAYRALKTNFIQNVLAHGGKVVANADYQYIRQALKGLEGDVYWYGRHAPVDLLWQRQRRRLRLAFGEQVVSLKAVPLADFHAENLSAVVLLMHVLFSVDLSAFVSWDGRISTPAGRLEPVNDEQTVFLDYAHTAEGLERCLQSARALTQAQLLLVFGCGGDRDKAKRPAMGAVAAAYADECWITSDNPRSESQEKIAQDILQGMSSSEVKVHLCPDRKQAIAQAVAALGQGDVLVIAGKGHERHMEIQGTRYPWSDKEVATQAVAGGVSCV